MNKSARNSLGYMLSARYSVFNFTRKFGVKKILARWVPRLLSEEDKRNRVLFWRFSVAFRIIQ